MPTIIQPLPRTVTIVNNSKVESDEPLSSIDPLAPYMSEIRSISLIDREQEKDLADRIHNNDEEALNELITSNLRLVVKIAHSFRGYGLSLSDLISEGNIGLMKAAQKFDPTKGAKFSSYAAWWIKQSMRKALSNQIRTIRIPVQSYQRIRQLRDIQSMLRRELGREPTDEELAEKMNMQPRNVKALRLSDLSCVSLQGAIKEGEQGELLEIIPDETAERPEHEVADTELVFQVMELLDKLPDRERLIIEQRYGLRGEPKTLAQVSKTVGLTKERVRQLQVKALKKLQGWMAELQPQCIVGAPVVEDDEQTKEEARNGKTETHATGTSEA